MKKKWSILKINFPKSSNAILKCLDLSSGKGFDALENKGSKAWINIWSDGRGKRGKWFCYGRGF